MATFDGTAGDDSFIGGGGEDIFNLEGGGSDSADGRGGHEVFVLGGELDPTDRIDGGGGATPDTLQLEGDYPAGVVMESATFRDIETLTLVSDFTYDLTLHDGNIAAGRELLINAAGPFRIDASAETDGSIRLAVGVSGNSFTGAARADSVQCLAAFTAADSLHGGPGQGILQLWQGPAVRFTDEGFSGFEGIVVFDGVRLVMRDANVAPGVMFDVKHLAGSESLFFNGSRERDGAFSLTGSAGADTLIGGRGDDTLDGGEHDDLLLGGRGGDDFNLTVGGADRIFLEDGHDSPPGSRDRILGLGDDDTLDLSAIDADRTAPGNQDFVLVAAFTGGAGEAMLVYDEVSNATRLLIEIDGKGAPDVRVLLTGGDYTGYEGLVL